MDVTACSKCGKVSGKVFLVFFDLRVLFGSQSNCE